MLFSMAEYWYEEMGITVQSFTTAVIIWAAYQVKLCSRMLNAAKKKKSN